VFPFLATTITKVLSFRGRQNLRPQLVVHPEYFSIHIILSLESNLFVSMFPLKVHIKHAGKVHDVGLDPDQPASVFKDAVYRVTGVPLDRMKIMIKGGILKVSKPHNHWAMADSHIWR
jgi:hypothetical protein